VRKNVAIKPLL